MEDPDASNDFVKLIWKGTLIRSGNYTYDVPEFQGLLKDLEDGRTLAGFSRYFIANPDLVHRLRDGKSLNKYDRSTFTPTRTGATTLTQKRKRRRTLTRKQKGLVKLPQLPIRPVCWI